MIPISLWFAMAIALAGATVPTPAHAAKPSQVHFATSCDPQVQADFDYAVTLLHSFEYPETTRLFAAIAEQDPDCAMAYWGQAMSLWHPLWAPPSTPDLQAGTALLTKAQTLTATSREEAYIGALHDFFASHPTDSHTSRAQGYEASMAEVYAAHLDDPEAALFYALALLASADPRDKSYTHQFKSAALLNWVKQTQPTHPGVLHYLIHSFDFPGLAHLALREATIYAETAPDSAHAQHMPSHIFTRLGLWERSLASNQDSTRSAEAYAHRAKLHGHYDEGLHSMDYLLYAMLQTARDEEARRLLNELRDIKATNTENFKVAYAYAAGPARFALERRQWSEAANLELMRQDFPWNDFGWALSIHHFGRGIGAARSGQVERARESLQRIKALQQTQPTDTLPYWREQMGVHLDAIAAWVALAEGDEATAISLARQAAEQEDAVDKHPVTPSEVLPARELYADLLLQTGRAADALAEYQSLLQAYPNRLNALLGAGYAAESIGDNNLARAMYATAVRQAQPGNPDRDGLARARAALD